MRNNPSDNARALLAVPLIPGGKDGGLPTMGWDEPRVTAVQLLFWPWPEKASSSGRLWKAHVQKRKPSCFMSVLGLCCSRRFHRHCCFDPQRNRARWLRDCLLSVSTKGESESRSRHSLPWLGVERERECIIIAIIMATPIYSVYSLTDTVQGAVIRIFIVGHNTVKLVFFLPCFRWKVKVDLGVLLAAHHTASNI